MEYYKMSIDEFKKNTTAVDTIGHPVRFTYINLGRKDIQVDHERAQVSAQAAQPLYLRLLIVI